MNIESGIALAARDAYDLAFQKSPIILTGGIVGFMPIIALLGNVVGFAQGLLSNGLSMSDIQPTFVPLPGGSVINNAAATYPFANQHVAANAIVQEPLNVSLQVIWPVNNTAGYMTKLALFTALVTALKQHQLAGGTFSVATPAYIYNDCLLMSMPDITNGSKQQQILWQLDFLQPLVSLNQASSALNSLMDAVTGGKQVVEGLGGNLWQSAASAVSSAANSVVNSVSGLVNAI